jgi:hypothetical protein
LGHTLSLLVDMCCGKTPISRRKKMPGAPPQEQVEFSVLGFGRDAEKERSLR